MTQPNILFLFPDQHRGDWLGCGSDLNIKTPNIDALAKRGTRFTRAYCDSPVCAPSRACLATGTNFANSPVKNNSHALPLGIDTLYTRLRDVGYEVCGVGKFDLDKPTLEWGLDGTRHIDTWGFTCGIDNEGKMDGSRSYRDNNGATGPYLKFLHDEGVANDYCKEHNGEFRAKHLDAYVTTLNKHQYCDNWLAQNGINFLNQFETNKPWFLQVNFTGPHNPMDVTQDMHDTWEGADLPQPFGNKKDKPEDLLRNRQHYAAMIENIDNWVGEYIAAVEARGELDNTIIVFSSDHGEMLGDHERWGKGTWREPSVHVPLVIAGPGFREGAVTDTRAVVSDLTATFLEVTGAPPLEHADAQSLIPTLQHGDTHRDIAISGLGKFWMATNERFKLVTIDAELHGLFDRQEDPWETTDVSQAHPEVTETLLNAIPKSIVPAAV